MQRPFVLPVQTALGKYFYEVNRNEIVKVNEELFNYIKKVLESDEPELVEAAEAIKEQFADLQECGYLAPKRVERIEHPATSQVENYLNRGVQKLTLQVTQNCNLRCKYCIYSENSNLNQRSHSNNVMSWETAKRAIDFYRDHSADMESASIGFYGGEPLLAFPLIKNAVEYAEEIFEGREIIYAMTTNATLMTDEMIDFMLAHKFKLTFSVDGPKSVHDKNRVFRDGSGSYDTMMKNIQLAYDKDPQKLKDAMINMVVEGSQDYQELLTLFNEPALVNTTVRHSFIEEDNIAQRPSSEFITEYNYDRFLTLFEYFRGPKNKTYTNKLMEQNILSFSLNVGNFTTRVVQFTANPSGSCIPGKMRLFVNYAGDFYPCEKVNENQVVKIGSLDSGFDFDKVRAVINVGRLDEEKCKNCWTLALCGTCARVADDGQKLSSEQRNGICKNFKLAAYDKILERILAFENQEHKRVINHLNGVNEK